ncbi:heme exporter protein CcmD [Chelativorans sp. ZYF759]|uniref:heme exporter protein CcmD n=1 Tax=Chelativorans sp. ZYF759 TaxID=2692213 RepID=UPI00145ED0A6|nr:heme exporter protein CcmD [Chelativorans sp. ZYF759]NMG38017.1 heme exporter protein CcmD [Chelativorans sp. ZYF759]
MTHEAYVFAAYAATFLVLAGIAGWLMLDHRFRRRELAELEARGIRRRSDRKETP